MAGQLAARFELKNVQKFPTGILTVSTFEAYIWLLLQAHVLYLMPVSP